MKTHVWNFSRLSSTPPDSAHRPQLGSQGFHGADSTGPLFLHLLRAHLSQGSLLLNVMELLSGVLSLQPEGLPPLRVQWHIFLDYVYLGMSSLWQRIALLDMETRLMVPNKKRATRLIQNPLYVMDSFSLFFFFHSRCSVLLFKFDFGISRCEQF